MENVWTGKVGRQVRYGRHAYRGEGASVKADKRPEK